MSGFRAAVRLGQWATHERNRNCRLLIFGDSGQLGLNGRLNARALSEHMHVICNNPCSSYSPWTALRHDFLVPGTCHYLVCLAGIPNKTKDKFVDPSAKYDGDISKIILMQQSVLSVHVSTPTQVVPTHNKGFFLRSEGDKCSCQGAAAAPFAS